MTQDDEYQNLLDVKSALEAAAEDRTNELKLDIIYAVHVIKYGGKMAPNTKLVGIDELDILEIPEFNIVDNEDGIVFEDYGGYDGSGFDFDELHELIHNDNLAFEGYGGILAQVADKNHEHHDDEHEERNSLHDAVYKLFGYHEKPKKDQHTLDLENSILAAKEIFDDMI